MNYRKYLMSGLAAAAAAILVGAGAYSLSQHDLNAAVEAVGDMEHRIVYPCGKIETVYAGPVLKELEGMDIEAVKEYYGAVEGLEVSYDPEAGLLIMQQTDELCSEHRAYRHLGISEGYVAVYEGPLGRDERVVQVEQIRVESLSPDYRRKLEQAMDFEAQSPEIQVELRRELEFENDDALHAALENLDELKD